MEEAIAAHAQCEEKQTRSSQLVADAKRPMGEAHKTDRELKKQNKELAEANEGLKKRDK